MKIHCAHNALVDPATLKPNPVNPNRHSAHQIQLLASIIQEQGWRGPITVSKRSGLIVRGHGRLEAALLMGAEKVPVDFQDYASEAEELADLLADNRLSELAELDEDDLKRVIESIRASDPSFDVELTGFMNDEIARLYDEKPEDDVETVPRMEIQAFEHHDYLVFMFHQYIRLSTSTTYVSAWVLCDNLHDNVSLTPRAKQHEHEEQEERTTRHLGRAQRSKNLHGERPGWVTLPALLLPGRRATAAHVR